jgi:hypothetical protein
VKRLWLLLETDAALVSGAAQDILIVFSDIRNFTALSRRLSVRELVPVNECIALLDAVDFVDSIRTCSTLKGCSS